MRQDLRTSVCFNATQYLAPYRQKLVRRPISLNLTENTYPLSENPEKSWISLAFKAFSLLGRKMEIKDLLVIGTGHGLDVLGAMEIFNLDSLTATDILEESLVVARENVLANLSEEARLKIDFCISDLLSSVPADKQFDFIFENLPNLPASQEMDLTSGINSSNFFDAKLHSVPEIFDNYLLALHYLCLQQAHSRVRSGGGILTSIGGRIPLEIVFDLHHSCGYSPELVVFDLKIQSEPNLELPAYCQAEERNGIEFKFYTLEALELVASSRRWGLEGKELADALEADLNRYAISAREALRRYERGQEVAHSVLMVFGKRH